MCLLLGKGYVRLFGRGNLDFSDFFLWWFFSYGWFSPFTTCDRIFQIPNSSSLRSIGSTQTQSSDVWIHKTKSCKSWHQLPIESTATISWYDLDNPVIYKVFFMYFNLFLNNRRDFTESVCYMCCQVPLGFWAAIVTLVVFSMKASTWSDVWVFSLEGISTISMLRKIYDKKREALMLQWDPSAVVVFFEWVFWGT